MKFTLTQLEIGDSDNSFPNDAEIQISEDSIAITVHQPFRVITIGRDDLERVMRAFELIDHE